MLQDENGEEEFQLGFSHPSPTLETNQIISAKPPLFFIDEIAQSDEEFEVENLESLEEILSGPHIYEIPLLVKGNGKYGRFVVPGKSDLLSAPRQMGG